MNDSDCGGAFTNRGRHAFHAPGANVAYGKDAGQVRLERVRRSRPWPMIQGKVFSRQVRAGLDESLGIARYATPKPLGAW